MEKSEKPKGVNHMNIETLKQAVEIGMAARALADSEFEKSGVELSACEAVTRILATRAARTRKATVAVPTRCARPMSKATWDFLIYR